MRTAAKVCGLLAAAVLLQGSSCSAVPPPSYKLAEPRAGLMSPIEPLRPILEGEDLYQSNAELRAQYARTATKAAGLQKYVRVILKKQKGAP